ncbi:MAG: putative nucleic acid-binding protein, contains PIN domain [Dehalococcoidia bacterium]|nr:putative nucleic acid-binding protein, contains PIN domain [Dehalococcoidia bacterium]
MTLFYLDTSAILKMYKSENGSEFVEELIGQRKSGETLVSSLITAVEVFSVASRMTKGNILSRKEYDSLTSRFLADFTSHFQVEAVDNPLIIASITITAIHGLRTADAIHLAAIQRAKSIVVEPEQFFAVTSDKEMIVACRTESIKVLNPEEVTSKNLLRSIR